MSSVQALGAIEIGLVYSLVAMGVYLTLRTLDFPDLSVDGTFPLGAAVCATLLVHGINPVVATLCSIGCGAIAGVFTAWLSTHLRFMNLLSGILTMTALYSINLRIMDRPNISLLQEPTLFDEWLNNIFPSLEPINNILILLVIVLSIILLLNFFLKTEIGLALRATGNNPMVARAQGINDKKMIMLGLALSNACVALGGALFAQSSSYADITMGVGTIIVGIAAVIIGEALINTSRISRVLLGCMVGAIVYRVVVAMALNTGGSFLRASDLNLITAFLVGLFMLIPDFRKLLKDKA